MRKEIVSMIYFILIGSIIFFFSIAYMVTNVSADMIDYRYVDHSEQCLTDCYLTFDVKVDENILVNEHLMEVDFKGKPDVITHTNWDIKEEKNIVKDVENCYEECDEVELKNGTIMMECESICHTSTINEVNWKDVTMMLPNKWYRVTIYGKKFASIDENNVDMIPTFLGHEFSEWVWWNDSWTKCKNLTMTDVHATNSPVYKNITGLTFANASKEIRIVDTYCNNGGNSIERHIISDSGDIGDGSEWAYVLWNSSTNTTYSVYYDNSGASYDSALELDEGDIYDQFWSGRMGIEPSGLSTAWSEDVSGGTVSFADDDGYIRMKYVDSGTDYDYWYYVYSGDNSVGTTIDLVAKTTYSGGTFDAVGYWDRDGTERTQWSFNTTGGTEKLTGGTDIGVDLTDYHVIRITLKGGTANVYVDGVLNETYDPNDNGSGDRLLWGDPSSVNTGGHTNYYDMYTYSESGAYPPANVSVGSEETPPTTTTTTTTIPTIDDKYLDYIIADVLAAEIDHPTVQQCINDTHLSKNVTLELDGNQTVVSRVISCQFNCSTYENWGECNPAPIHQTGWNVLFVIGFLATIIFVKKMVFS